MTIIHVRPHSIGGRATCPCGWVVTTTRKAAYVAAQTHNDKVHSGNYMVHTEYTQEQ